jgi:ABC-type uncharacterized transport system auxiliary subunit
MTAKVYLLIALIVLAWGCGGPTYYDLHINSVQNHEAPPLDKVLQVDDIETNQTFWYQRMVYRKSAYEVKYFFFKQWAKRPGELIQDTVVKFYKNSRLFTRVINDHSSMDPDLVMKIHVDSLEMLYEGKQWYAHLALDMEVMDARSEKIALHHYFDRKMEIGGKDPSQVPGKISQMLQQELMKIYQKLKRDIR